MDKLPNLVNEILTLGPQDTYLTGTVAWGLDNVNSDIDVVVRVDAFRSKLFQMLIAKRDCTCVKDGKPFLNDDLDLQSAIYNTLLGSAKVLDCNGADTGINLIVVSDSDYTQWVVATDMMAQLVNYKLHITALMDKNRRHAVFEILRGVIKSLE